MKCVNLTIILRPGAKIPLGLRKRKRWSELVFEEERISPHFRDAVMALGTTNNVIEYYAMNCGAVCCTLFCKGIGSHKQCNAYKKLGNCCFIHTKVI